MNAKVGIINEKIKFFFLFNTSPRPHPPLSLLSISLLPPSLFSLFPTHLPSSSPFLRNPSRILLAPLPTSSLPSPYILPTTSLLPLCILPATFLGECFPLQIYRARFIVPVPPDRLHIHPAVSPCFLRLQSDYPRRDVGGTSEKPRS